MGSWQADHNKELGEVYVWMYDDDDHLHAYIKLPATSAADLAMAIRDEVYACLGLSPGTTTSSGPGGELKPGTPDAQLSTDLGQLASPSCCSPGSCTCGVVDQ